MEEMNYKAETNNKAELKIKKIKLISSMSACFLLGMMTTNKSGALIWLPISIFAGLMVYGYLKAHIESED